MRIVSNRANQVLRIVQEKAMLRIKAYGQLVKWKKRSNGKTALLVEGGAASEKARLSMSSDSTSTARISS